MYLDSDLLRRFISTSPSLEHLRVLNCKRLTSIKIPNHVKLKNVVLGGQHTGLSRIEIEAPSLESFLCDGLASDIPCEVNLEACKEMRT